MAGLVYYSSASGNTARFIARLGVPALRIAVSPAQPLPRPDGPYALICPTYADGEGRGAVPKQVIRFLNDPSRRALLRGVIGAGNRNFGKTYACSADVISAKCNVPVLTRFELAGTEIDLERIREGLSRMGLCDFRGMECSTTAQM